jgi:hypothetical protein
VSFKCAICGDAKVTINVQTNHVPVRNDVGALSGFLEGIPTAQMKCEAGCSVSVRGQVPLADLGRLMGLPSLLASKADQKTESR